MEKKFKEEYAGGNRIMKNFQVAIDGPAGSGKSTISKLVAKSLKFIHIDTGAMYRAVTIEALKRNIPLEDESAYGFLDEIEIEYKNDKMLLNGVDVSEEIRTTLITQNVSAVSKLAIVRTKMVALQQKAARRGQVVMDGRDIGYVVLPNANLKIFLTASVEERAKRRHKELSDAGKPDTYEEILSDIIQRDYKDSHRENSPLRKAEDAILLDTTNMSIEAVAEEIKKMITKRLG